MSGRAFSFGISSGQIFQAGIVVANIEASMKFYVENLRVGPFTLNRSFVAPAGSYRGGSENPVLSIAHVYTGRQFIELIEQHSDIPSVYTEYTDKYGFGLHHFGVAIAPEDYDRVTGDYYARGFEDVFIDQLPSGARIRYISPKDPAAMEAMKTESGVAYIECVEVVQGEEGFFSGMREAALTWDGKTVVR